MKNVATIALALTLILIPWESLSNGNSSDAASRQTKWSVETLAGSDARSYSVHYQMES